MFQIGKLYDRIELHEQFGGGRQSGISPSRSHPIIFLFSGKSGKNYGYEDGWQQSEGVFLYTGEGQLGDMTFSRGNKAIRDHVENGKQLHLFLAQGKGKPVEYAGEFECASIDFARGPDRDGNERQTIRFHLVPSGFGDEQFDRAEAPISTEFRKSTTLQDLRARALRSAKPVEVTEWRQAVQVRRQRRADIREYVLKRASGVCELTGDPAPFLKLDGTPYLEVHHIRRLSDGGIDHPVNCAAITPNAHREIHFGAAGEELDNKLAQIIAEKEKWHRDPG
ncbi:HNH endonuclease signature motif containing protein [Salibaculum griseiflavum]|uniref:HNH endonuclease n=1 Tax=Salibaculum griseiflavum TaxID=1914409 RepID=A0A2V1P0W0_9RHOB|nr:HNH endonuclease [Salibaculum griseiflavum]PWG16183.1 HNH endonuclease [Salibaculum griseiflavum]